MAEKITFQDLNKLDIHDYVKKKLGFSYLSWSDAWMLMKERDPESTMTIYTRKVSTEKTSVVTDNGVTTTVTEKSENDVPYFTDGKTAFVKVGVTFNGVEQCEIYPVMDVKMQAVALGVIKMTQVNTAIQRAFVKACARHGLGLYLYSGEDIPYASRKNIDFKAIAQNCDRFATVALNQEGFDVMLKQVIALLQDKSYSEDASKAIVDYATAQSQGKRISTFTLEEDAPRLQRIYNFINEVKKALAAPNDD